MKDSLWTALGCVVMIVLLIAVAFLGEFIFRIIEAVGLFLSGPAAPYLMKAFWTVLIIEFFIILPISFIPKCKEFCCNIIVYTSFFYGFLTWIWGFVAAYFIWGKDWHYRWFISFWRRCRSSWISGSTSEWAMDRSGFYHDWDRSYLWDTSNWN